MPSVINPKRHPRSTPKGNATSSLQLKAPYRQPRTKKNGAASVAHDAPRHGPRPLHTAHSRANQRKPNARKASRAAELPNLRTAHETNRFFVITSSPGTFNGGRSCGIALNSTTRRHPRLGLVAGSRGPTQIHIRSPCHWASEPAGHLDAESPSRRTAGPASARKTSLPFSSLRNKRPGLSQDGRLVHTDCTDCSGRGAQMQCPGASVLCLSPPLVALLLTRLTIRSGQSHPGLYVHATTPAR